MEKYSILWRRLDVAGHDACRLTQRDDGWRLKGAAVFQHEGTPVCLGYEVDCDSDWRTQKGAVHGWMGDRPVDLLITRKPEEGMWSLNGQNRVGLDACVDLDFGFTPATNLFQLRRMALQVGHGANVPVAWMDVSSGTIDILDQRYERRTAGEYWYEAPQFQYFALLKVNEVGFVENYPNLWEKEP